MQGKVDDAIGDFNKATELDPADAEAEGNLGHALLSKDKVDDAIPHLKRAGSRSANGRGGDQSRRRAG